MPDSNGKNNGKNGGSKVRDFLPSATTKKMLQVRIEEGLLEAIQKQADSDNVSMTDLISAMCLHYLRECGKPYKK